MIDLDLLRTNSNLVKESIEKRGGDVSLVDTFNLQDNEWREKITQAEKLRQERNELTSTKESAIKNSARLVEIKKLLQDIEQSEKDLSAKRQEVYLRIPQIIDQDIPVGPGESA